MIWDYLVKLNIHIPDNPAVTPKDWEVSNYIGKILALLYQDICTGLFISNTFYISKILDATKMSIREQNYSIVICIEESTT